MGIAREIVRPPDCAFVLTFPRTKAEFHDDVARGSDFLKRYFQNSRLSREEQWNIYKPVAELTAQVVSALQRYGVHVILRPSFSDCATALAQHKVTILFAHWRSSEIYEDDIAWEKLSDRLMQSKLQEAPNVFDGIREKVSFPLSLEDKTVLLMELNRTIREESVRDQPLNNSWVRLAPTRERTMFYNRKALDVCLPGCVENGASIEFSDGLRLIENFVNGVSPSFAGLLDLSVCNSILLGELIKVRAPNCLVIGTELPAIVEFRLMFYESLFELLRSGRAYLETSTRLREELLRSLKGGKDEPPSDSSSKI